MKKVFAAHKDVNELFIVDGVPFLKKNHALNHAKGDESKVKVVTRNGDSNSSEGKSLEQLTIPQLRSLAKDASIQGYGNMNKKALIEALRNVSGSEEEE